MINRLETFRVYRATSPLSFLQISDLCTVPTRFYESLNEKIGCVNYTCFPKSAWSQILMDAVPMHFIEKFDRENIDGHHLRPPVLAILLETIERENYDGLLI